MVQVPVGNPWSGVPRQVLKIIVSLALILSIDAAVSIMKAARRYLLFIGN